MVSADDLNRPRDLLQRCVIENGVQCLEGVEKCRRLLRHYATLALAHQQRIENLNRPERRYNRLFA